MPYIEEERRPFLDQLVREMTAYNITADGDLNYVLHAYLKRYQVPLSYGKIKNYCAELEETAREIRRVLLAPYEDAKKDENGDV
jgi:hypothetical protein